jgi:hypothetical protein
MMTYNDLYFVSKNSNKVKDLKGLRFIIDFTRNLEKIEELIKTIEKTIAPTELIKEFFKEIDLLKEEYADVSESGEKIFRNEKGRKIYIITKRAKELEETVDALKNSEKYQNEIAEHERKISEFESILNDDCKIDIKKISEEDVPSDITMEQFIVIRFMVE